MIGPLLLVLAFQPSVVAQPSPTPIVVQPVRISGAAPDLKEIAHRCQGVKDHGVPVMSVDIGSDGLVKGTGVVKSCGCAAADKLVMTALKTWKYTPASVNGRPVPFSMTVVVTDILW